MASAVATWRKRVCANTSQSSSEIFGATTPQRSAQERNGLRQARCDQHSVGPDDDPTYASDVVGERCTQWQRAEGSRVTQLLIGHGVERPSVVAKPLGPREKSGVGQSADETNRVCGFGVHPWIGGYRLGGR